MTKSQTALIRESSKKDFTAHQWRKRMERWLDFMPRFIRWPIPVQVYESDFGQIRIIPDRRFGGRRK